MGNLEPQNITEAIIRATRDVLRTMLNVEAEPGPSNGRHDAHARGAVLALVGVGGKWSGSGRVSCSAAQACRLAGAMLGTKYSQVNEEVLDAMGEVANMIIGNIKTDYEERLGPMALSIPTIVYGRNYQAHDAGIGEGATVRFQCLGDAIDVHFCLAESPMRSVLRPMMMAD